jgi:glycosyltransferase involved in cell wall biosynthesis
MKLTVVFGTRGNQSAYAHIERIFSCLAAQTFQEFQIICIIDKKFEEEKERTAFTQEMKKLTGTLREKTQRYSNSNADFLPEQHNASYVRNFGIQQVDTELIQLFDDDNGFDATYLEKAIHHYEEMKKLNGTEVIICPTLRYKDTKYIQNQGFSSFRYWQSRPVIHRLQGKKYDEIQMFSGNGLLGSRELFQTVKYDEEIARIAEDMDFTLSAHEHNAKLFVFSDIIVRHYERDKTKLEQARIGSAQQAQQKARNRFLFVRKHGNRRQKLQFLFIGVP